MNFHYILIRRLLTTRYTDEEVAALCAALRPRFSPTVLTSLEQMSSALMNFP